MMNFKSWLVKWLPSVTPSNRLSNMETPSSAGAVPAVIDVALHTEVARLARILEQFDREPPALPEGERLSVQVGAIEGRIDAHERRLNAQDGLFDAMSQLAERVRIAEAAAGVPGAATPRDMEHEARETVQTMQCGQCLTETTRTVLASHTHSNESPCAVCSGVMKVVANAG
jgi:hypothetical protein